MKSSRSKYLLCVLVALLLGCNAEQSYSSSGGGGYTPPRSDSDEALKAAVDELESARKKLAGVAYDDAQRASYAEAIDRQIEEKDYDFDGVLEEEKKARLRFRNMLLDGCRAAGIAPPDLWELGTPFGTKGSSIAFGASSTELPQEATKWIAKRRAEVDPVREEFNRLNASNSVAQKILAVTTLRRALFDKLGKTRELLKKFEADMTEIAAEIAREQTKNHVTTAEAALNVPAIRNDLDLLRSKRAYVRYLTATAARLEAGTTDLLYIERQSRDEFGVNKLMGGEESKQLRQQIDLVLQKYQDETLDRKLDVAGSESPRDIFLELQAAARSTMATTGTE